MSYTLSRPSHFQRSGLLLTVIGLHIAAFLLIVAAKTVVPQIMEIPLVVDLLETREIRKEPVAKPLPMNKPTPAKAVHTPQQQAATPLLESTQSNTPAAAAIATTPTASKPPATPAEAISLARFDADYLKNPAPPYPPLARRMGEEGKVLLRVSVTPQGTADNVEIRTSSGSLRLDDAAQKTVRYWRFIPAKSGETAVHSWVLVPIIFKLEQ